MDFSDTDPPRGPPGSRTPRTPLPGIDKPTQGPLPQPPTPTQPPKRRRLSINEDQPGIAVSASEEPADLTSTPTSIATSRPRRKAAEATQAQITAQYQLKYYSNGGNGRTKTKGNTKAKDNTKSKQSKSEEYGEVNQEEDFECPCGGRCSTITECEETMREAEVRDLATSIGISSDGVVEIFVGDLSNQQSFLIHKELLMVHSDYFADLFAPSPRSGGTATVASYLKSSTEGYKDAKQRNVFLKDDLPGALQGASLAAEFNANELVTRNKVTAEKDLNTRAKISHEQLFKQKNDSHYDDDEDEDGFEIILPGQFYKNVQKKKQQRNVPTLAVRPGKPQIEGNGGDRRIASGRPTSSNPPPSFITDVMGRGEIPKSASLNSFSSVSPYPRPATKQNQMSMFNKLNNPPHFIATPASFPVSSPASEHTINLPPSIIPLPFTLFISYINNGYLAPSLFFLTEQVSTCTWENLWALGHKLRAKRFMNFCMEGLRGLERVHTGEWPSAVEASGVWELDISPLIVMGDGRDEKRDGEVGFVPNRNRLGGGMKIHMGGGKYIDRHVANANPDDDDHNPLKLFTASCIARLSPLTSYPQTTYKYRVWERSLRQSQAMSMAVHKVDLKLFGSKTPWDEEFRGFWKVEEQQGGLRERWREVLENGGMGSRMKEVEERAEKGDVGCLLKMLVLKGEGWVMKRVKKVDPFGMDDSSDSDGGEDGAFSIEEYYKERDGGGRKRYRR